MKIAMDARGINWYKGTGIGTYTENILKNLLDIDKENFYHLYWSGDNYDEFLRTNSKIIMASKKHQRFFEQNYFPYNLSKENIDIYHVPQNGIGLNENIKCKKIVTIHDLIPYILPETVGKGYLNKFLKDMPYIMEQADCLITVSEWSKRDIIKFFQIDQNKIFVTPLAADMKYIPMNREFCKKVLQRRLIINKDFILYIGGFSPRKNVKGLIDAFRKVYGDFSKDLCLLIVGSLKDQGSMLKEYVNELNMEDKIIFTGFVEEDLLPLLYNACECFIYPSLYEGFGLPPLEAMSCGAPVITSDTSSIPEVVKDAGILINPLDKNSLSEAMLNLINNDHIKVDLINKGIIRAQNFSWRKTSLETLNVYSKFVDKSI